MLRRTHRGVVTVECVAAARVVVVLAKWCQHVVGPVSDSGREGGKAAV